MAQDIIARALALRALSGQATGVFAGYVTPDSGFPLTRPDGSPISNEDYVRPQAEYVPFELPNPYVPGEVLKFETKNSKAIYFNNDWVLDPGSLQDTSETLVANYRIESVYANPEVKTQQQINAENAKMLNYLRHMHPFQMVCKENTDDYIYPCGVVSHYYIIYGALSDSKQINDITEIALVRDTGYGYILVQGTQQTGSGIAKGGTFTKSLSFREDDVPKEITYRTRLKLAPDDAEAFYTYSDPITVKLVPPVYFGRYEDWDPAHDPTEDWTEWDIFGDKYFEHSYSFDYGRAVVHYSESLPELTSILASIDNQTYENYFYSFEKIDPPIQTGYRTYIMKEPCALKDYIFRFINKED